MEKRTERRKHFLHTNVAGFMYWDGCEAFSRLEVGTKLEMVREADNKHDCDAVALYYKDYKLGFIPGSENEIFAQFLDMGHSDLFEVRVCDSLKCITIPDSVELIGENILSDMYLEAQNNQNYSEITKYKPLIISAF